MQRIFEKRNNFDWKNKEAWHFVMGQTPWNREVREQHSISSVTPPQVISSLSWPPSGSNGVSALFDSIGSCTPAESWNNKGTTCWGPHLELHVWPNGPFAPAMGSREKHRYRSHTKVEHSQLQEKQVWVCTSAHSSVCAVRASWDYGRALRDV